MTVSECGTRHVRRAPSQHVTLQELSSRSRYRDPAPALTFGLALVALVEMILFLGEEVEAEALVDVAVGEGGPGVEADGEALADVTVGEALDKNSPELAVVDVLLDVLDLAVVVLLLVLLLQLRVVTRGFRKVSGSSPLVRQ